MNIKISNLSLDLQNPRYEVQKSQSEALNTMADDQKDKLLALLRDIIENGLNPSDLPIVMPDSKKDKSYIVLEGNRRIAALKLLKKPEIVLDKRLQAKYRKLHDKHKDFKLKTVECLVVGSREEANLWIERKHEGEMEGIGTIRWTTVQKSRFLSNKSGKDSVILQLIDFMKIIGENDDEFQSQLQRTKATNIERLLGTPEVRARLGLDYNNGLYSSRILPEEAFRGLKAIIKRLSRSDFNVKSIYHKDDRLSFLNGIPDDELPELSKKSDTSWLLKDFLSQGQKSKPETSETDTDSSDRQGNQDSKNENQSRPTSRDIFIPENLSLPITNDRINRLFSELKRLSHNIHPNACAILLRVFIELSVDSFLEEFSLLSKSVVSGSKDSRSLKEKTNTVIQKLESLNMIDSSFAKGIRSEMNKDHTPVGIDTLHAYVHNSHFNPIPETLMYSWDNIEPFIVALWKAINEKEK